MASQIRPKPLQGYVKQPKPVQDKDYHTWIKTLPCVITGHYGVDAAHVNEANPEYGHTGRGKSQRAFGIWILPLSRSEHDKQHSMNEAEYWKSKGINPWVLCLTLWGIHSTMGEAGEEVALETIRRAKA